MGILKGVTAELLKELNEPTPLSLPPLLHSLLRPKRLTAHAAQNCSLQGLPMTFVWLNLMVRSYLQLTCCISSMLQDWSLLTQHTFFPFIIPTQIIIM